MARGRIRTINDSDDSISPCFSRRRFMLFSAISAGSILSGMSFGCAGATGNMKTQTQGTRMKTVRSKDGTEIAYWVSGKGPPLLLVHGTTADHTRWTPILPAFEDRFTVYSMDRRGRGASGDTGAYVIEREFEDIAAVIDAIRAPVYVLGHSYGAICSLESALLTKQIAKLILYEPPVPAGMNIYPVGAADRIQSLVDAGDRDGAVSTFFREVVRTPATELDKLRSLPAWNARVSAAHTIAREMTLEEHYKFIPERFQNLHVPTLLLLGGDSPAFFKKGIEIIHEALPDSHIVIMPGQQHAAMNTAPELFTSEVLGFLED